jgi:hypothetical protein
LKLDCPTRTPQGAKIAFMKPGLEEWFKEETAELHDGRVSYAVRLIKLRRLIQAQEGVCRIQIDGSITSPIDPEEIEGAKEYLERLRNLKIAP